MNDLCVYASPLPFSNKQVRLVAPLGSSVKEIMDLVCPARLHAAGIGAVVFINGHEIYPAKWHCIRPKAGTIISIRVVPQGGRGGGKNPIASLLSIAVLIAAPYAGAALAGALGVTSTLGVSLVTGAVGLVGKLLVSALAPPPKPSNFGNRGDVSNAEESPTQFIEGAQNSLNPFGVIPICLGTNRMVPPQAARPYTETQDNNQYVRQLFTYGYGQNITVSDLKIGETALSEFSDFEIDHRLDGDLHEPTALFPLDTFQNDFNVLIQEADDPTLRTTQADVDETIVDVTFPQGLCQFNGYGQRLSFTVELAIAYSLAGADDWTELDPIIVTAAQTEALRRSKRIIFPAPGTYDIRISRTTADSTSDQVFDKVYLTAIKSVRYQPPVHLQGLCGTAVRIRATDQLNGAIDQFNALVSNHIPDYDADTDSWIVRATSNPASIYRYVLQGEANERPLPDSKLDLEVLADWHIHCAAQGYSYNRVIDYETSVDEILRDVTAAGAASPAIVDGKRTVVIDRLKDDIVQLITPRNSWDYSAEMTYPDMPHAFRVQFRNAAKGYQQDERIVYDDGYDESNATKFEALELQSCTDADLAFKTARRHIASARLRPESHSFMMDVENLVALRGDRIKLEHDVPIVGVGDGRIKSVQTSGGNVTGFVLDDNIAIPSSGTYYARIRLSDGTWLYRALVTTMGEASVFSFAIPFPEADSPSIGDLCAIMEAGGELDLIITKIEPQDDLSARITAVNYAPEVFTAESAAIPAFNSRITTPLSFLRPLAPVLVSEQSDEAVMLKNSDGSFTARAVFTLSNRNEGQINTLAKVRKSGTDVFTTANVLESTAERLVITGLEDGARYDIHIYYQRRGSTVLSLPLQLNNYKFTGASGLPSDVTGFVISVAGQTAMLKWDASPDIDLSHYRIKFSSLFSGATWGTAQLLENAVYENRLSTAFQPGTYLIKAVDLLGNESQDATAIITYNPGALQNAVEQLEEHPVFSGTKDNVLAEANSIMLADTDLGQGYYYFANDLDLGGLFTSFVSASVVANGIFVNNLFDSADLFAESDLFGAGGNDLFGENDLFAVSDLFGIGADGWAVQLQYRVTAEDPTGAPVWSDWTEFTTGTIEFWGIQFRLKLVSLSNMVSPQVTHLSVLVDMPDRIERGDDLTVGVGGAIITYDQPFNGNPAVAITIQDGEASDKIEFLSKDAGGFSFKVYNTATAGYVERTYDFITSGYGRKRIA